MTRFGSLCAAALAFATGCATQPTQARATAPIQWERWSDAVFDRARAQDRFVLLDLEAVWCHWCHVMDTTTYADPRVAQLIGERFIAVRVDQDSRPDLSNRYEDYGWPATIVFGSDGGEIAKRSGYIPPRPMESLLRAILEDPTPGPSVVAAAAIGPAAEGELGADLSNFLEAEHRASYDREHGGFGFGHKYLDAPSVELAILRAQQGDEESEHMARETLDRNLALVDPVWGGVYQYSAGGDWNEPHFEKIMSLQADNLRTYALAFAAFHDEHYRAAAQSIARYLREFLTSPDGAFFTSQDADLVPGEHSAAYFASNDADRRALGVPRIDTHVYARENGSAIRALVAWFGVTGDETALAAAKRAADWVLGNRAIAGGGFRHDERDEAGPYLGDTLAMGQAFLALYEATGERRWLGFASDAARFIAERFAPSDGSAGLATADAAERTALASQPPQRAENVDACRFSNLLFHYTDDAGHAALSDRAWRWIAAPEVARRRFTAGVLLAAEERDRAPAHVTIVGAKDDPAARTLHAAALALPTAYRRIEWFDRREGALPGSDVEFPELGRAAAFACAGERCSSPAFEPADVAARVNALR